jgi:hypothetical protein
MNFVTTRLLASSLCISLLFAAAVSGIAQETKKPIPTPTPTPTPWTSKYKGTLKSANPNSQIGTSVRGASPSPSPIRGATPSAPTAPKKKIVKQDRAQHTPTPTPTPR